MNQPSALNYQEEGRRLLTSFYGALSALKLYPVENETVQVALGELHGLVERVVNADGGAEVRAVGDFFFLNETRLRLDLSNFATFGSFASALQAHGIGAVEILPGIEKREWAPFISMLLRKPTPEDPFEGFTERLAGAPVQHIRVRSVTDAEQPAEKEEKLIAAKRTYAQSVKVAKDVLDDLFSKALVLEQDGTRVALVVCDLVSLPRHTVLQARRLIERQTGIPAAHVMISATHTHTGPAILRQSVVGQPQRLESLHQEAAELCSKCGWQAGGLGANGISIVGTDLQDCGGAGAAREGHDLQRVPPQGGPLRWFHAQIGGANTIGETAWRKGGIGITRDDRERADELVSELPGELLLGGISHTRLHVRRARRSRNPLNRLWLRLTDEQLRRCAKRANDDAHGNCVSAPHR